ncbi:MAG: response regulator transcription factor, partial [Chloroflexota bacterium]
MKTHTNRSVSSNAHKQINHYREMAQGIHQSVIQVMLVDDHELMRQGLRAILSLEDDIRVIDEVGSGRDLLSHLDAGIQPDVILMDIQMPGMSGLEATRLVALKYPNIKIVALTGAL